MKRESFIVYKSFYSLIKLLKTKERLAMFEAIFEYGFDGTVPTFKDDVSSAIWEAIFPQLKANQKRYENGLKGGAPINNQNAKKEQPNNEEKNNQNDTKKTTKKQPNENVNENDNVNVNVFKVSKKENRDIFKNNTTHTRENLPSYEEVMDEMGVEDNVKLKLWEFIQHCNLNGRRLTNSKLESIIIELDKQTINSFEQIKIIDSAISGGFFDIKKGI